MSAIKIKSILNQIDPNALKIAQMISRKDEEMKDTRRKLEDCNFFHKTDNTIFRSSKIATRVSKHKINPNPAR